MDRLKTFFLAVAGSSLILGSCAREEKKSAVQVGDLIKGEYVLGIELDTVSKKFDKAHTALVTIDVQNEFCDPYGKRGNEETYEIAKRIHDRVPNFRQANVDVMNIYSIYPKDTTFYYYRPDKGDANLAKFKNSAFAKDELGDDFFKLLNKKTLLMCGFNMSACVRQTAEGAAAKGYDVYVIVDMVGDDRHNTPSRPAVDTMAMRGVKFITAADALNRLK